MIESRRYHETIVDVLAAFIREQTTSPAADHEAWDAEHHHEPDGDRPRVTTDIQAALTVIGHRPQRPEHNPVDLSLADLCGADLSGLNLNRASLWRTKLRSAIMHDTQLNEANLCWAQLQDAGLAKAHLRNADLSAAQLQKAMLMGAQLQHAKLDNANLQGAYLAEADLHHAVLNEANLQSADFIAYPSGEPTQPTRGLTAEQLTKAITDDATRLPER